MCQTLSDAPPPATAWKGATDLKNEVWEAFLFAFEANDTEVAERLLSSWSKLPSRRVAASL